jgi:pilus assembly protein CpaE
MAQHSRRRPGSAGAINAGVPLAESSRNSAVVRELGAWADALSPQAREDSNGF